MNLADELRYTATEALKQKQNKNVWSDDYLVWRKLHLIPEFFAKLKRTAEHGLFELFIPDDGTDQQWERWCKDHDLGWKDRKIIWTIHG